MGGGGGGGGGGGKRVKERGESLITFFPCKEGGASGTDPGF